MNDKEIMDRIKETAEDVSVPEELQPDAVEAMLEEEAKKDTTALFPTEVIDMGARPKRRWKKAYTGVVAAAMAAIILIPAALQPWAEQKEAPSIPSAVLDPDPAIESDEDLTITASVGDFGDTLRHPESYKEIYDRTEEYYKTYTTQGGGDIFSEFPFFNGSVNEDVSAIAEEATADSSSGKEYYDEATDYSHTNTREEDVAEGDVTVTDGKYIYHYTQDGTIEILGTEGGELTEESVIYVDDIDEMASVSYIRDMYVQGNSLIVIADGYYASLKNQGKKTNYLDNEQGIVALVYDIEDREKPRLSGYTGYDGDYYSSRVVDGVLYMFTTKYPDYHIYEEWLNRYDEDEFLVSGSIPSVNGEPASLDCIYMPEEYHDEPSFVMSSVKLSKPNKVVDYRVIMGYSSDIYVSSNAVYLQSVDYSGNTNHTVIARMNYKNGKFAPSGVGVVKGVTLDKFAIDEDKNGNLRVATTVVSYGEQMVRRNQLVVFDDKMKQIGKLGGLARGEEIKSARYIGDYCYLVTFENTDPLFTIDCSDPEDPVMVGELKMPGFSDYLHPWVDGKLFGFGYAGDEEGLTEGLKLTMFDVSSPSDVEIISEERLREIDYSAALTDYKSLLVSPEHGMIGFACENYYDEYTYEYRVYNYVDDEFELVFAVDADGFYGQTRGVFIGDVFYLIGDTHGASYDMSNNYEKLSDLYW